MTQQPKVTRLRTPFKSSLVIQANLWGYFGKHLTDLIRSGGRNIDYRRAE